MEHTWMKMESGILGTVCDEGWGEGGLREMEGGENATMKPNIVDVL